MQSFREIILDDLWIIILSSITSVGGVAGLIVFSVKFSVNLIAERLQKKYELRLSEELEKFRSGLDKKNYICKALFDKEFVIYQELSEKFFDMFNSNIQFMIDNKKTITEDEQIKLYKKSYEDAFNSHRIAHRVLHANAPFIPKEIYEQFCKVKDTCTSQLSNFNIQKLYPTSESDSFAVLDRCFGQNKEISDNLFNIFSNIREYLNSLDVY